MWNLKQGANVPQDFYLEGVSGSSSFRDVQLTLRYTNQGAPAEDKANITVFALQITTPVTTAMDIDATPKMPDVTFSASLTPQSFSAIDWYLMTRFTQHGRNDRFRLPMSGTQTVSGSLDWKPTWGDFFHGADKVEIHAKAQVQTSNVKVETVMEGYQIRGTDPSRADILAVLTTDQQRAICWQETTMRQFVNSPGFPIFGPPNGWGLMQFDPPPDDQVIWNWRLNANAGIAYLNRLHADAQSYLNYYYNVALHTPSTADNWSWNPHTDHPERVWDDAFSRYNAGTQIYDHGGNPDCATYVDGCAYAGLIDGHIARQPW
jgi:hypothetical protein